MRRKLGLLLVFGAAAPLAAASVAWACGVLATLSLDTRVAAPGQAITASGKNYSTATGASDIVLRLQSRTGQILTSATPVAGGGFRKQFALPERLDPGWYIVLATQFNANGTPKSGTPGRTTLRIQGTSSRADVAGSPWTSSKPSAPAAAAVSDDGGSIGLLLLAGALSLTMLAAGWALVGRKARAVAGPQLGV